MKKMIVFIVFIILISCKDTGNKADSKASNTVINRINIENIGLRKLDALNLDKSDGKEIVDYSYNFLQTSLYKRHVNTIGLTIDPTNYEYIRRYSYSYKKAGEHIKGMKLLNLAIEKETEKSEQIAHLGYASWNYLYFLRDYRKAISSVDTLMGLYENEYDLGCHGEPCLLIKGIALYRQQKYKEAIKCFEIYQDDQQLKEFDPMDNFLIVFYKARCYKELKLYEMAIDYFSHLIKEHPQAETYFQLASTHYELDEYNTAKTYIELSQDAFSKGYVFEEPYFERFDRLYQYQIDEIFNKLE